MSAAARAAEAADLSRGRLRMALLLALLPLAALAAVAIGMTLGVRGRDVRLLVLAVVTLASALVPVILDQGRLPTRRHVLLSMMSLVYMAHFVTPSFTSYIPAVGPVEAPGMAGSDLMPAHVARGQTVALYGLGALMLGYAIPLGRAVRRLRSHRSRDWPPMVTLLVALVMVTIGWLIQIAGQLGVIPEELGSGVLSTLGSALVYGNVLLTYSVLRHGSYAAFVLLCAIVPVTSALGFFTGSKTYVLVAPMMVVLTTVVWTRRIRLRWVALGVVALALLYPTSEFFRAVILADYTLTAADALQDPNATIMRVSQFVSSSRPGEYFAEGLAATGARLDGLGVTSVIVRDTPRVSPFQNGRTLWLFFVAFVPRVFWPSKPTITIGEFITDVYGSGPMIDSDTGPTQIGDYYLNFGTPGVVAGMVLLGILLRLAHEVFLRDERPTASAMLAVVVILYQLTIRFEGGVAAQYASTAFALIPLGLIALVIRILVPTPRTKSPTPVAWQAGEVLQR